MNISNFTFTQNFSSGTTIDFTQVVRELAQSIDSSIANAIFLSVIAWGLSYFLIDWILNVFRYPKIGMFRGLKDVAEEVSGLCLIYVGVIAWYQGIYTPLQQNIIFGLFLLGFLNFLLSLWEWFKRKQYLKIMSSMDEWRGE